MNWRQLPSFDYVAASDTHISLRDELFAYLRDGFGSVRLEIVNIGSADAFVVTSTDEDSSASLIPDDSTSREYGPWSSASLPFLFLPTGASIVASPFIIGP